MSASGDQRLAVSLEGSQGVHLVFAHEATVADHIGRQYRGESTLNALLGHGAVPFSTRVMGKKFMAAGRVSLSGLNVGLGSRLCENADTETNFATVESGR